VKAYQKVDIEKGTFLPHYKTYSSVGKDTNTYPVVGFDPVEMYVNELKKTFDEIAYFFYDSYGDTRIHVLWKQDVLKQIKEINKENRKLFIKDAIKNKIDLNLAVILEDLKTIGKDLVDKINVKSTSSIFE
jgi:U3 small nucleolar RNA-associated protein 22